MNNEDTGKTIHKYCPKIVTLNLVNCKLLTNIYTAHGAFPTYLYSFVKKNSPNCECGDMETRKHHLSTWPLTQALYLDNIIQNNGQLWYHQLGKHQHIETK